MQNQTDKEENVIHPWAVDAAGTVIKNGIISMCPFQMKVLVPSKNKLQLNGDFGIQEFPCTIRCPHCNLATMGLEGQIPGIDSSKPIMTITCGGMPLQHNFVDLSNENQESKLVSMQ